MDTSFKAFETYRTSIAQYLEVDLSESDTRAKFIDVFVRDVLGWPEAQIRRERSYVTDGQRAAIDYELSVLSPVLVIEAKKALLPFELPDVHYDAFEYSLSGVAKSCPNLYGAIEQARQYCDDIGAPFGLVTNGRQFALFRAIVEGGSWRKGTFVAFDLDTLAAKHFRKVYIALSHNTCSSVRIDHLLGRLRAPVKGRRIADSAPQQAGRLSNQLLDVVEIALAEIFRDPPNPSADFLRHCFVSDTSRDFYGRALESLLSDPLPVFAQNVNLVRPGYKKDPFARSLTATLSRQGVRPPTVLIGGKGFGKTTFLNWTFKVSDLAESFRNRVIVWIDFKEIDFDRSTLASSLMRHIADELEHNHILHIDSFGALEQVFGERLQREMKLLSVPTDDAGTLVNRKKELVEKWRKDIDVYLNFLISYSVVHCRKSIVLVFDNADQKDFDFQKTIFDLSQLLSTSYPITILLALRESTYFRLSQVAAADAFSQQQVFHIQAPNLAAVISNRLAYLAQKIASERASFRSASGMEIGVDNLSSFIDLLRRSLLDGRDTEEIKRFLIAMSNGSIRMAFRMIYEFLVSGHTKMEDYFWNYASDKTSQIPFHEFFASVLLDEMGYFSEANSYLFINLFARSQTYEDSHFSRLRILKLIQALSRSNSMRPEDFVNIEQIRERFTKIGLSRAILDGHLHALLRFGLIQSDTQQEADLNAESSFADRPPSSYHLTACGLYYLEKLCFSYQYLYRIIPDTPIFNDGCFRSLDSFFAPHRDRYYEIPLRQAVDATLQFFAYLKAEEENERNDRLLRDEILGAISFMRDHESEFSIEIANIRARDSQKRMNG